MLNPASYRRLVVVSRSLSPPARSLFFLFIRDSLSHAHTVSFPFSCTPTSHTTARKYIRLLTPPHAADTQSPRNSSILLFLLIYSSHVLCSIRFSFSFSVSIDDQQFPVLPPNAWLSGRRTRTKVSEGERQTIDHLAQVGSTSRLPCRNQAEAWAGWRRRTPWPSLVCRCSISNHHRTTPTPPAYAQHNIDMIGPAFILRHPALALTSQRSAATSVRLMCVICPLSRSLPSATVPRS